jgi:hypothetical protein
MKIEELKNMELLHEFMLAMQNMGVRRLNEEELNRNRDLLAEILKRMK